MPIPSAIPHRIPDTGAMAATPTLPSATQFSEYDVAIGGIPFFYAINNSEPLVRETAPFEKNRVDQEDTPGEQTLTGWWVRSQDSFNGGAGQLQLEPSVPTPVSHIRYLVSKNVDVFTPGRVSRLPDTTILTTDTCAQMVGVVNAGVDAIVYVTTGGTVKILKTLDGVVTTTTFSGVSGVVSIATDGTSVYAANTTTVVRLDPTNVSSATTLVTFPGTYTDAVLGWEKARLCLGVNRSVYIGIEAASAHTLVAAGTDSFFFYTHPSTGFVWRCFAESPTAILAAGDALGVSIIIQFDTTTVSGVPTLQPDGQIAALPVGERIISMLSTMGTFLGLGTTRGFRVGEFDSYFSRLTYGPLQLDPTEPTIPCNVVLARDRFFFAVGKDYDEGGLQAIDLGTKTDDSGRFAWSPHLITPAFTSTAATAGTVLASSARLAFYVAGTGIVLEGIGAGSLRASTLTTSRIRYGTTEPKLFKLGRVRGDLTNGTITIAGTTRTDTSNLGSVGFTTIDPNEFRLPTGAQEWLVLTLTLTGADVVLTSYQLKALPGTRRQRHIQPVLSLFDNETSRTGLESKSLLSSRARLEQLEALDAAGDVVLLQEFTPGGVVSTPVVIEQLKFAQSKRPTRTSDVGGLVTVLMRTVE